MLAGAIGIDFVLLVVAADDGPMPQTREHVQIVDLLGLKRGIVALTKIDAVSPERAARAEEEVRTLLRGTSLSAAAILRVSSTTGEGVQALQEMLEEAARTHSRSAEHGHFRLSVDRCFALKGAGTIVTGTAFSGRVRVGSELTLSPPGISVRVRSLHVDDRAADEGGAGQRCALNLVGPGFDRSRVERGFWVVDAGAHAPTQRIDVHLRLLTSEARSLVHWTPAHLHLGASDVTGRVALLESDMLAPGGSALAQLVLDRAVGAAAGDRFIVRDQSATRTIGGGRVLDPFPPQRGRRTEARLALLHGQIDATPSVALRVALEASATGVDLRRFCRAWNLRPDELKAVVAEMRMRQVESADTAVGLSEETWRALAQRMLDAVLAEHRRAPDMIGVARERLRRLTDATLAPELAAALVETLLRLTLDEEKLWTRVQPLLAQAPFQPPRVRDLARTLLAEEEGVRKLLKHVARLGKVYPVAHDHYFTQEAVTDLAQVVRELNRSEGAAAAAAFRDRIGTGRKLAIQILEFFDRVGFTRRAGDAHVLRQPGLFAREGSPVV
jgi:selenocysteine-specific elongation factor